MAVDYLKHYPFLKGKFWIVPSGIDLKHYQSDAKNIFPLNIEGKIISYIGRLDYPKRIKEIIEAFSLASAKMESLFLVIAGEGRQFNELKQTVRELNLNGKVLFVGKLSRIEVLGLINQSAAGILLSYSEGSPISIKEFLAVGVPVIANKTGDIADYIINDLTGKLVNPNDKEEIASAILDIVINSNKLTDACKQTACKYDSLFSFDSIFSS